MLGSGDTPVTSPNGGNAPTTSTGKRIVASLNPSATPPDFSTCLQRLLGSNEPNSERVECYMALLGASRSVPEDQVPNLFSLPDFPGLLSAMSVDIQRDGQVDVTHAAIRVSGFFCHYANPSPPALSQPFQDLLNSIILRGRSAKISEDKTTVMMSLWFLGAQRLQQKQMKSAIGPIMELVTYGIEIPVRSTTMCAEACNALSTIYAQGRGLVINQNKLWALPALMHLVHPDETVQSRAEALFQVILVDEKPGVIDKSVLDEFVKAAPSKFIPELEKLSDERALRAWRTSVAVAGAAMHRTATLNGFLKVIEKFFNSKDDTVKKGAYDAWIYLIYSFAIGDHLLHEKRLALILTPYLECLRNRREPISTKLNVIQSWYALLFAVGGNLHKFAGNLLFQVLSCMVKCDSTVESKAYEVFDKLLETSSGSYKPPGSPDIRRLLSEEPIQTSDLCPMDPKSVRTNIAQFAGALVPLLARDTTTASSPTATSSTTDRFWLTLLSNLAAQARLELNMGPEMQASLDSLVQFVTVDLKVPNRTPVALLSAQGHLLGTMLDEFPGRILTARTKSDFLGKRGSEVLERMLLSDSTSSANWPRIRYSPLLSITKAWLAMPGTAGAQGELEVFGLFGKILDKVAESDAIELYLSLLVAIEECPVGSRQLPLWAALASTFGGQVPTSEDVFAEEGTFYEALATLLMPVRHPEAYSDGLAEAWQDFWNTIWDAARVKQRNPSNVMEQVLERLVVVETDTPSAFEWLACCYRAIFDTASKDVSGLLSSTRKRSPGGLLTKLFFILLDLAFGSNASSGALATAADLCTLTLADMPDLLADSRFRALETMEKFLDDSNGIPNEKREELVKVVTEAYEKSGVSDNRERLTELGAIINLVAKSTDVRPKIGSTLQHILADASKVQDLPLWLRNAFSKLSESGVGDVERVDEDELLLSGKKHSRYSLAPKLQAAKGSDPAAHLAVSDPWVPPAQADTQDFVPIAPIQETPGKRPATDDDNDDSQEERRRKRKASIPNLYNSLDQSQEAPLADVMATPQSESKRRRTEESPTSAAREEPNEDMPTSPTSARNSPSLESQQNGGAFEEPAAGEDDAQPEPMAENEQPMPEIGPPKETVSDLVDRLLDMREELSLLDSRSLMFLQKKVATLGGAILEALERTLA